MARRVITAAMGTESDVDTSAALFLDRDGVINAKAPAGRYITEK